MANRSTIGSDEIEALLREVAAAPVIEPSPELFPLSPGTLVAGAYRIDELIGTGGMGLVYRATDIALQRSVALKLHRRRPTEDGLDRLLREASVMARLSHPHVVTIHEVGHHEDPTSGASRLFVAMEYVDGGSVVAWAKARQHSWRSIVDVFVQAGRGLAAAHAAGVVHRDFKPANVLIDTQGRVRVADFGLARLAAEPPTQDGDGPAPGSVHGQTEHGAVLGTPAYMAPEQWRGEASPKADQYALCVSLFEVLYGHNPIAALGVLAPFADEEPRWEPTEGSRVPARILRVLRRGLSTDPAARYGDVEALIDALQHDPWRAPRRVGAALAVVGISSAVAWSVGRAPVAGCDGTAVIGETWNDAARQGIHAALSGDVPYAEVTTTRVTTMLDRYARAWSEEEDAACRAAVDEDATAARRACLRADRRRFEAVVAAVQNVGERGRPRVIEAVADLPDPSECASATALPPSVDDPRTRAELTGRLDALEATIALWQDDDARRELDGLGPRIEAAGEPDLQARLQLAEARLAETHDDSKTAVARFDGALASAVRSGDSRLLARVAARLSVVLSGLTRVDEADRVLLLAEAAVEGREPPVRLRLLLASARMASHQQREDYEAGAAEGMRAVALAREELGDEHPTTINFLDNLSSPLRRLQRYDEAMAVVTEAIEINERVYGPEHPSMAKLLDGRGTVQLAMRQPEDAAASFRESLRLHRRYAGPAAPPTVRVASNLGSALLSQTWDRERREALIEEAGTVLEPIVAALEAEGRTDELGYALLWDNVGALAIKQGRPEDAIEPINRALRDLEVAYGVDSVQLGPALSKLASALAALRRYGEARGAVTRAIAVAVAGGADPANLARVQLQLGMIEKDAGNEVAARKALEASLESARRGGAAEVEDIAARQLTALGDR
ncbi:MAG: serine/threonine-protein kinase [Myxococcota bacterium]